jgi:hypothetical protein
VESSTGPKLERLIVSARLSEKTVPSCSATKNFLYSTAFGSASAFENASVVLDEPAILLKGYRRDFFNRSKRTAPGFRKMPLTSDEEDGGKCDDLGVKRKGKVLRSTKSRAGQILENKMKPPLPRRVGLGYRLESPLRRTYSALSNYDDSSDEEEFEDEDMNSRLDRLIAVLREPPEQTLSDEKRSLADDCANNWDSDSDDDDRDTESFLAANDFEEVDLGNIERNLDDIVARYHAEDKDDRLENVIDPGLTLQSKTESNLKKDSLT